MLSIRLRRTGTTKRPYYRVVVADPRAWRDGRFVEVLGHYDPRRNPAVVKIDTERFRITLVRLRAGCLALRLSRRCRRRARRGRQDLLRQGSSPRSRLCAGG